jgi:hypothetical protein
VSGINQGNEQNVEKCNTWTKMKDMNNWNEDGSHLLTSFPAWNSENFRHLIFVAQSKSVSYVRRYKNISVCLLLYSNLSPLSVK